MNKIALFTNKYDFLSNFYSAKFMWQGFFWPTVEHAYQAKKTVSLDEQKKIRLAQTPGHAKAMGMKVQLRPDWEKIKVSVMTEFVWQKFDQNPELLKILINTGEAELVEGNYWHDNFWGDCYCSNCLKIKGENVLGTILMKIRSTLRHYDQTAPAWYIPTCLRKKEPVINSIKEVIYAIGQEQKEGNSYGMWHDPNPNENEMLEIVGKNNKSVIVQFDTDGTNKIIWRWHEDRWIEHMKGDLGEVDE